MVCDFFYPRLGGVENHIWNLAQNLLLLGHHVVVVTHAVKDRTGIRVMTNGLKVYYISVPDFIDNNTYPGLMACLPLMREIFVRERVEIVHCHQTSSSMAHEGLMHAKLLGLRTVFTEHSLFGFVDMGGVHLNKLIKCSLSATDACIAVSEMCRNNMILRGSLDPNRVVTIPNAVDADMFQPAPERRPPPPQINVVVISRLAYRKGIDLIVRVLPKACARWPHLHFLIGGDGPKRLLLHETVERHQLHSRVEILGQIPHAMVRSVLTRGSVFLNTSLTESFCIAILEAACCGLLVVSTRVGGIPEVLPPDMIEFHDGDDDDEELERETAGMWRNPHDEDDNEDDEEVEVEDRVVDGLIRALGRVVEGDRLAKVDPEANHARLKAIYSWRKMTERTVELVYDKVCLRRDKETYLELVYRYQTMGAVSGFLSLWLLTMSFMYITFLDWLRPRRVVLEENVFASTQGE